MIQVSALDAEAEMKQLGMGLGDDGSAPAITLAEAVQAQLVTLMARSLLALVDPSTEQNPAGGDDDRRSDEP